MNFNKKVWWFIALSMIVNSCARPISPEWEDLTSSPKSVLTVMALLSLVQGVLLLNYSMIRPSANYTKRPQKEPG